MITSQNCYPILIPDLQCYEQRHGLQRIISPVYIIPHEEVVGVWTRSPDTKQLRQVVELPMDVTTDCHGGGYRLDIRFLL